MHAGVLTEPTLFNLFRSQRKHRKQFKHYFDDDIRQYRSGWGHCIDVQTLQEVPQALEEVEQCIVTRRNPTGSLPRYTLYGNRPKSLFEGHTSRSV